jgi:hypothetical protein
MPDWAAVPPRSVNLGESGDGWWLDTSVTERGVEWSLGSTQGRHRPLLFEALAQVTGGRKFTLRVISTGRFVQRDRNAVTRPGPAPAGVLGGGTPRARAAGSVWTEHSGRRVLLPRGRSTSDQVLPRVNGTLAARAAAGDHEAARRAQLVPAEAPQLAAEARARAAGRARRLSPRTHPVRMRGAAIGRPALLDRRQRQLAGAGLLARIGDLRVPPAHGRLGACGVTP